MKRNWMIALVLGLVAVLGLVSIVSAQAPTPATPVPGQGFGPGMMGGRGQTGGTYGPMHEYMEAAIAEKLGITVEALEKLHAEGKTFWQIAEEKGLTVEQAQQLMTDARSAALDKMVEEGAISQEQADWMKTRGGGRAGMGGQMGAGGCAGGGRWNGGETNTTPRGRMGGRR